MPRLIFAGMLFQLSIPKAACAVDEDDPWLESTIQALEGLRNVAPIPKQVRCPRFRSLTSYLPVFENFLISSQLERPVHRAAESSRRKLHAAFSSLSDESLLDMFDNDFFPSPTLRRAYNSTFKRLMEKLRDFTEFRDKEVFGEAYKLDLKNRCPPEGQIFPKLSVKDICPDVSTCTPEVNYSSANACGKDNSCDKRKALPLMAGVFFYNVSIAFHDKFCPTGSSVDSAARDIAEQLNFMELFHEEVADSWFSHTVEAFHVLHTLTVVDFGNNETKKSFVDFLTEKLPVIENFLIKSQLNIPAYNQPLSKLSEAFFLLR